MPSVPPLARLLATVVALIVAAPIVGCGDSDGAAATGGCDPNYDGACLDPDASDYDCEGGSGNGPRYTGPVRVVGDDPFGLDRDGDGYACE
jgi:hypothetical protein